MSLWLGLMGWMDVSSYRGRSLSLEISIYALIGWWHFRSFILVVHVAISIPLRCNLVQKIYEILRVVRSTNGIQPLM